MYERHKLEFSIYALLYCGYNVIDTLFDPVVRRTLDKAIHVKTSWVHGSFQQQKKMKFAYFKLIPL